MSSKVDKANNTVPRAGTRQNGKLKIRVTASAHVVALFGKLQMVLRRLVLEDNEFISRGVSR
jgi:hypothetical protein